MFYYDFVMHFPLTTVYSLFYPSDVDMDYLHPQCNYLSTQNQTDVCDYSSLCNKAGNTLSELNSRIRAQNLQNNPKLCEYLSYFINDNIQNNELCNNSQQLYNQLNKIIRDYTALNSKCNIKNFEIAKDAFIKKKKLYLLGEILYSIKEEYGSVFYVKPDLFNNFFGECVDIYKNIVHADNCEIKNEYKKELNDFIDNFNNAKAYLNENNKSISHDYLQSFNESRCQQELNGKQAVELPNRGAVQGVKEEAGHRGPEGEPGASVLAKQSLEQVSSTEVGIEGPAIHMSTSDSEVLKEHTDEKFSSPVGTIIGTSLGFVVPLITIYKFTPLGSWINTKVLGRDNILKNMERNNQHLLLNSTENREINLGDTMYRIKYNS
ncbi:unnamed protein product [Plasmodium vivax]|uniref:(malaria parasite P. vivax) hypothetical protein n=1 Tax=Plasmodium vivax TaxID=5855 RepID=A0A8S4HD20_PLAVI|nr:unnamed protein product [Plasmodium vivax]